MTDQYFVVTSGEDGTIIKGPFTREALKKQLDDNYAVWRASGPTFLDKIPESDKGCWWQTPDSAMLVIRGQIVVPKAIEVALAYEVP